MCKVASKLYYRRAASIDESVETCTERTRRTKDDDDYDNCLSHGTWVVRKKKRGFNAATMKGNFSSSTFFPSSSVAKGGKNFTAKKKLYVPTTYYVGTRSFYIASCIVSPLTDPFSIVFAYMYIVCSLSAAT